MIYKKQARLCIHISSVCPHKIIVDDTKNALELVLPYLYIFKNIFFLIRPLVVTFALLTSWRHYNCI